MVALMRHQLSRPWSALLPAPAMLACALSALQCVALLALLLRAPRAYGKWRSAAVAATRLYRLGTWVLFMREGPALLQQWMEGLTVRMFLLSPASGNVWFSLFFPLPLDLHLGLLLVTTAAAVAHGTPMTKQLAALSQLPPETLAAYERFNRLTR